MKRTLRVIAGVLAALLMSSLLSFAAVATIVSPATNAILYSDSILVSVKVTDARTVRVTVFEEKEQKGEELVAAAVASFNEKDLALIAAKKIRGLNGLPAPGEGDGTTSDGQAVKSYVSTTISPAADYVCGDALGFYTKKVSDLKPGLFRVQVDTLQADGTIAETAHSLVAVKTKPPEEKSAIFPTPQPGAFQFLQTILKSIFR